MSGNESGSLQNRYPNLRTGILDRVRVVDLTHLWSGPLCTRILTDLGADVVKVEAAGRPDGLRLVEGDGYRVPSFDRINRGKRLLALDIRLEEARRVLADLISASDVVVDNYSPRVVQNWGLGWDIVSQWPGCVLWVSMPAFSQKGPYRFYGARGSGLEAIAGIAADEGGDRPHLHPFPVTDPLAGWHAAVAVLAGLQEVARSERSLRIEVPQSEVALQLASVWQGSLLTEPGDPGPYVNPDDVSPRFEGRVDLVGADTVEVMRELDYSERDIAGLSAKGAIHIAQDGHGL